MDIAELTRLAHENAVAKGFYDTSVNIGQSLMLIVTELSEALEAHRNGRRTHPKWLVIDPPSPTYPSDWDRRFKDSVKDTFEDELADAVIRIADLCGFLGIDLDAHVVAKMHFNKTRPRLHGKAY